jgi:hypothetical protein
MNNPSPAEPVVGDQGSAALGGFAKIADHLNALYPNRPRPISRQLAHKWWMYRHSNGFPEAVNSNGSANGGRGRPLFDIAAVEKWHANYIETRRRQTPLTAQRGPRTAAAEPQVPGSLAA